MLPNDKMYSIYLHCLYVGHNVEGHFIAAIKSFVKKTIEVRTLRTPEVIRKKEQEKGEQGEAATHKDINTIYK